MARKTLPGGYGQENTSRKIWPGKHFKFRDFGTLSFNPMLGRQRIADNPSVDQRSYEVIQPESASSPEASDKRGKEIVPEGIIHFLDRFHN